MSNLSTEKNAQCENCELRVIWSKMMTIAWEVVFHRGGGGDVNIYVILVKRDRSNQSHIWKKVAARHEEQVSLLMILVLFWI